MAGDVKSAALTFTGPGPAGRKGKMWLSRLADSAPYGSPTGNGPGIYAGSLPISCDSSLAARPNRIGKFRREKRLDGTLPHRSLT